jgi:hypothetical protein
MTYRIVGWTIALAFSALCWYLVARLVMAVFS